MQLWEQGDHGDHGPQPPVGRRGRGKSKYTFQVVSQGSPTLPGSRMRKGRPKDRPYWRDCREIQNTCKACHRLHCGRCSPCVKGNLAQKCFWAFNVPYQQHTYTAEHLVRYPEVLVGDPNKSLEVLGQRKENPEIPAEINRYRRG